MNKRRSALLNALLSQPTAPFREQQVIDFATAVLKRASVPYFQYPFGNLVVGVASAHAYRQCLRKQTGEPSRLFIAHMDHPGFHGIAWRSPARLAIQWRGGSPVKHLIGSAAWLAGDDDWTGLGHIAKAKLLPGKHALDSAEVTLAARGPRPLATSLYGGFSFRAPVWRQGRRRSSCISPMSRAC